MRWHGDLPRDGVGRFAFVAATPERAGAIVWKAVQRYDDGSEDAWIGPRHSDHPAPVTNVGTVTAPRQDTSDGGGYAFALGGGFLLLVTAVAVTRRRRGRPRAEAW